MSAPENILPYLSAPLRGVLERCDAEILMRVNELRLHRGGYVIIVIRNTAYFLDDNAELHESPQENGVTVSAEDFDSIVMAMCEYSLHSVMAALKEGYLTLPCGARIGLAHSAVYDGDRFVSVKEIVSLNIRFPHAALGCSKKLLDFLYVNAFPSVLIAGAPNAGKTTLLRDMARLLGGGFNGCCRKITMIDERNEFAAKENGVLTLDVGVNTDVLTGFPKEKGIEIALRSLSPEMIICDEIATAREAESVLYAFSSGVRFALSVHAATRRELMRKPIIKTLLESGEFSYVVLMNGYRYQYEVIDTAEVLYENNGFDTAAGFGGGSRRQTDGARRAAGADLP